MDENPYQSPGAPSQAAAERREVVRDDDKSMSGDLLFRALFQLLLTLFAVRVVIGVVGGVVMVFVAPGWQHREVLLPVATMLAFGLVAGFMYWLVRSTRFSSRDVRMVGLSLEQLVAVLGLYFLVDSSCQLLNAVTFLVRQASADNRLHLGESLAEALPQIAGAAAGLYLMMRCRPVCERLRRWGAPTSAGTLPGTAPSPGADPR